MSSDRETPVRATPPGTAQTRRMAASMLIALAARALLPFPWNAVALVPVGYGVLEGIGAMRAIRDGGSGTVTRLWVAVGLSLMVMLALGVLLPFVTFADSLDYQQCVDSANTAVARGECREGLFGWQP